MQKCTLFSTMLPTRIMCFLTLFDVCGFYTNSSSFAKRRKYIVFVYFVHFIVISFLTIFFFHLIIQFYPVLGITEAISEFLQYSIGLLTYYLIIFDSILYRRKQQHFWNVLRQIYARFQYQAKTLRSYIIKIVEFFSVTLLIVVVRLSIKSFVDTIIDFAYAVLFKICQLRIFYYIFCLEVIYFQLKIIETELKNIQILSSRSSICFFQWLRKHFEHVYEMVDDLNGSFGWSNVSAISYCFYILLTDLNWFYIHYHDLSHTYCIGKILNYYNSLVFLIFWF